MNYSSKELIASLQELTSSHNDVALFFAQDLIFDQKLTISEEVCLFFKMVSEYSVKTRNVYVGIY